MSCLVIELVKSSPVDNDFQHYTTESKERKRYIKNKMLYEAVLYCIKEKNLDNQPTENVHEILISEDILQHIKLNVHKSSEPTDDNILGLTNISSQEISYAEGKLLKNELEQKLFFYCNIMHRSISDSIKQYHSKTPDTEAKLLIDFAMQLNNEQDNYMKNLHKHMKLLKELIDLQSKCVTEISKNKVKEYNAKNKLQNIKSKLLHDKTKMDIFTESKLSLDAYRELMKDIGQQQQECRNEVEHLCELKEKYQLVSCRQFENILKSYTEYKTATEKRKKLFQQIKIT